MKHNGAILNLKYGMSAAGEQYSSKRLALLEGQLHQLSIHQRLWAPGHFQLPIPLGVSSWRVAPVARPCDPPWLVTASPEGQYRNPKAAEPDHTPSQALQKT